MSNPPTATSAGVMHTTGLSCVSNSISAPTAIHPTAQDLDYPAKLQQSKQRPAARPNGDSGDVGGEALSSTNGDGHARGQDQQVRQ